MDLHPRAVVEPMKKVGGGSIINVASVAGMRGTSTLFAYTATKCAVGGMWKSAAHELARFGIRVKCVIPGFIDTPFNHNTPVRMNELLVKSTPLRRAGEPAELAGRVLFLAAHKASFATGTDFVIDGGMSI